MLKVVEVQLVLRDLLVLQGQQELKVVEGHKGHKVMRVFKGQKVLRDQEDLKDLVVLQV